MRKIFFNRMRFGLVLLLAFTLSNCNNSDDTVQYNFVALQAVSAELPESFQLNNTYTISVDLILPNGCTSYEGFDITQDGTTIRNVVAIGSSRTDMQCIQIVEQITEEFQFICKYTEPYLFRFYTGLTEDGAPQYFEVEVPVTP
jgi:hypothetical protein